MLAILLALICGALLAQGHRVPATISRAFVTTEREFGSVNASVAQISPEELPVVVARILRRVPMPCRKYFEIAARIPKAAVPKETSEVSCEEVLSDMKRIEKITGKGHKDPRQKPKDFSPDPATGKTEVRGDESPEKWPLRLGQLAGKQLFIDDYLIENSSKVVRRLVPGQKMGVVLKASDPPSETATSEGFSFYGNVVHDGNQFIMFYRSHKNNIGRAVSKDGQIWNKTGLVDLPDESNLKVQHLKSLEGEMCVQYDPGERDPNFRYYAGVKCQWDEGGSIADLCLLSSPDGLSWRMVGHSYGRATDTYPCIYKEQDGYVGVIRHDFGTTYGWREVRGASVLTGSTEIIRNGGMFSKGTHWFLDRFGSTEWRRRSMYGLSRTKYSGMYIGIAQIYQFPYGTSDRPYTSDIVEPFLVTSRSLQGETFELGWIRTKKPLITRGRPDQFDHGVILTAADWLTYGGHHWLYYAGWNAQHELKRRAEAQIGLIRWDQDRITQLSLAHEKDFGTVTTKEFTLPDHVSTLHVNADCRRGWVGVTLKSAGDASPPRTLASAIIKDQDGPALQAHLKFERGSDLNKLGGHNVRLLWRLTGSAKLYAFQFI